MKTWKIVAIVLLIVLLVFMAYRFVYLPYYAKQTTVVSSPTSSAPPVAVETPAAEPIIAAPIVAAPMPTTGTLSPGAMAMAQAAYAYDTNNATGYQGVYGQSFGVAGWGSGGSATATSFADCERKCDGVPGCAAVSYNTNMTPNCQMAVPYGDVAFNSFTPMVATVGYQLGVKS